MEASAVVKEYNSIKAAAKVKKAHSGTEVSVSTRENGRLS
jgi:hypothetical protein